MAGPERTPTQELLDEESLAVLAILLAVALEFGFGFAKTVDWCAGQEGAIATDLADADRGSCALAMPGNLVRGSHSAESAEREIAVCFADVLV